MNWTIKEKSQNNNPDINVGDYFYDEHINVIRQLIRADGTYYAINSDGLANGYGYNKEDLFAGYTRPYKVIPYDIRNGHILFSRA